MSIKDIARLANTTTSTVSRVLNNSGYVAEETRKRIEEVIKQTGYKPNALAKSLKYQKSKAIGLIIPQIASDSVSKIVEAVTKSCDKLDYQVILANSFLDIDKEIKNIKLLSDGRVDGIILMSSNITDKHIEEIKKLKIPVVVTGQYNEEISCVYHNDFKIAYDLTTTLLKKGYKKIGLINVKLEDTSIKYNRYKGYKKALIDYKINEEYVEYSDFSFEEGYNACKRLLTNQLDAIIGVTDKLALGALSYINETNNNIKICGIGNNKLTKYLKPRITTVELHNELLGIEAVNILIENIKENKIVHKEINYEIILGE